MVNLSIYVGTYQKYNEGSLYGKWIDLSNYSNLDEFFKDIKELHNDEDDPEFMFQDYEASDLIKSLNLISESHLSSDIFEILDTIDSSNYDVEVIEAYLDCMGYNDEEITEVIERVEESYNGEFNNDVDFTQNLLEDCGDIPENLPSYIHIDWESTARDIMFDYSTSNNHYFRNY